MEHKAYGAASAPLKRALELSPNLAGRASVVGLRAAGEGFNAEAIPHLEKIQERTALGIALMGTGQLQQAV
jgi:hypothetical protein